MRFLLSALATCCAVCFLSQPVFAQPAAMNMQDAVNYALKENKAIDAAYSGAEASESARKAARGAFGPSVSTSYGYDKRSKPAVGRTETKTYGWQVSVDQPLFTGFNILANYQKSALQQEQAQATRRQTELATISSVQSSFLGLLSARENVRSAKASLDRLNSQLKVTTQFYEVGLKPRLDVLQAETDVAAAEDSLLQAQNALDTRRAELNTLLNLPLESNVDYTGQLDYVPFKNSLEDCLDRSFRLRPDVYIARKSVEIGYKDKMAAASRFYPQISGYVMTESSGDTWRAAGSDDMRTGYSDWSIGFTANWNIFEWGQSYYATQQASHLISKIKAEEENLLQQVAYDVKSKFLKIHEADKRIKVAMRGLEQAQEAFRMAVARYEAQVGTNTDVLTAQASLTQAEAYLTSARADYLTALSNIYVAMGEANPSLNAASGTSPTERVARPKDYTPQPDSNMPLVMPWQPYNSPPPRYPIYPASATGQPDTQNTQGKQP